MLTQAVGTVLILVGFAYLVGTLVLSRRKQPVPAAGAEPAVFVFVVPALNEERVIRATVDSLLRACGDRGRVLVIDDGSDDATADILGSYSSPRVSLLRRSAPNARQGKGAALNHAFRVIRDEARDSELDPSQIVLGIVDADGRIEPDVLTHVGPYFRDPQVGAVQLLVRIRNRARLICRFQDYEFLVFSSLTQTAREKVGSVGLGGNGQFTRLSALIGLGDDPWSDCLTEDLDLGVRLAVDGWSNRFCGETFVDQQGLDSPSRLLRQRTRWAHGHFQCWRLIPRVVASQLPTVTVLDLCYYLLAPAVVLASSVLFTVPLAWGLFRVASQPEVWATTAGLLYVAALYLFSFGPAIFLALVYRRRSRELSIPAALLLGHLLAAYNYVWYAAEWKALARIVGRRGGWAKTSRVTEVPAPVRGGRAAVSIPTPARAARHAARPGRSSRGNWRDLDILDEMLAGGEVVSLATVEKRIVSVREVSRRDRGDAA